MKSRESVPLDGSCGRPYIEPRARSHSERGSPNRVVMSLREGETSKLCLQGRPSCLGVSAHSNVVAIMVMCPHHGMGWHGAIVSAMMALLA